MVLPGKANMPDWGPVLGFRYPDSPEEDAETHVRRSPWRMRGGGDEEVAARFSDLAEQASAGALDRWADDPRGRLALIVVLDQFARSAWRDSPRAFAQDPHAQGGGPRRGRPVPASAPRPAWRPAGKRIVQVGVSGRPADS